MTREDLIQAVATQGKLVAGPVRAVIEAIEAAGFRIVPVEPTKLMLEAADEHTICDPHEAIPVWRHMLAASPLAPEEASDGR